MKTRLYLLIPAVLIVLLFFLFPRLSAPQEKNNGEKIIKLGSVKIIAEIADTDDKKTQGLSGRTFLPRDRGMLFVFSRKDTYSFWMKDMRFPLDFVWIDGNKVVGIAYNVPYPKDNIPPADLKPKVAVDKVLEVNAGVINSSQVKIGDQLAGL